jgi:hypothetical protein
VCKYNEKNEIKKIDKKMQSNSFYFQIWNFIFFANKKNMTSDEQNIENHYLV